MSSVVGDPRQQIHGFGMASHATGYGPQFNNPFHSVAGQQQSIYPTANDSYLAIDPLSKISPHHQHHAVTSAGPTTLSYQPAPIYAPDHMRMNALTASAPTSYPGEVAFSSAAMPPPSMYSAGVTSGPVYDSGYAAAGYLPSNATNHQMADRRISHPSDYQRASQLSSSGPQFGNNFLDALEASKGLMDMGHDLTDATPRAERQRNTSDGYFPAPATHSNASSISGSSSSYGSYFGSMDSNASGYSSSTDIETLGHPQRLPGVSGLLSQHVGSSVPPAPQSMMTQFSSKISTGQPKKHKCKICDKRFTRPSSLQTHTYSHTGEKPFVCSVEGCGRHFSVVSNLRRHAKVHRNNDGESESYTDTDHGSPTSEVSTQDSIGSIHED